MTGGAGYIGSHASKALEQAGYGVVVLDNLSAGHREAVRDGELIEGDVGNVALVRHILRDHQISGVMHFAALLDVGASVRDPVGYYRNNVVGHAGSPRSDGGGECAPVRLFLHVRDLRRPD